jgi:hypothetical protein
MPTQAGIRVFALFTGPQRGKLPHIFVPPRGKRVPEFDR